MIRSKLSLALASTTGLFCTMLILGPLPQNSIRAQNLTAPILAGSWQSTHHNPAMLHFLPGELTVGLPGLANDFRLQHLDYSDLFTQRNGERLLDLANWSALARENNEVQNVFSIETLGGAYRWKSWVFSAYHRLRTQGEGEYPKELVDLLALGNAAYIGQTVSIAPRGTLTSWQEVGVSASYALSDRIAVAGRLKYLAGASNIQSVAGGRLELTTGAENYSLTLDQDYTLQTVNAIGYRGLDEVDFTYSPNQMRPGDLFGSNTGLAADVGVAIDLDRLRLNASATDLGAGIDWREGITTLSFQGSDRFTGLDILTDLLRDTVSLQTAVDTLRATFEPTENAAAYRTDMAPSFHLGGEYDLTQNLTAGALLVLEDRNGRTLPVYALSARYALSRWLQLGGSVNYRTDIRTNVGLHLYASPGRFRFLVSSDKFVRLVTTGNPSLAGIRLGASWVLGASERNRLISAFRP
jgi:hypothetical protein